MTVDYEYERGSSEVGSTRPSEVGSSHLVTKEVFNDFEWWTLCYLNINQFLTDAKRGIISFYDYVIEDLNFNYEHLENLKQKYGDILPPLPHRWWDSMEV